MAKDAVDPLRKIQKRAEEILAEHGLRTMSTAFVVEPHVGAQFMVTIDEDWKPPDPINDELEAIARATEEAERREALEQQAEKTKRELTDLRQDLGGGQVMPGDGIL